jgi:hypothetical protein
LASTVLENEELNAQLIEMARKLSFFVNEEANFNDIVLKLTNECSSFFQEKMNSLFGSSDYSYPVFSFDSTLIIPNSNLSTSFSTSGFRSSIVLQQFSTLHRYLLEVIDRLGSELLILNNSKDTLTVAVKEKERAERDLKTEIDNLNEYNASLEHTVEECRHVIGSLGESLQLKEDMLSQQNKSILAFSQVLEENNHCFYNESSASICAEKYIFSLYDSQILTLNTSNSISEEFEEEKNDSLHLYHEKYYEDENNYKPLFEEMSIVRDKIENNDNTMTSDDSKQLLNDKLGRHISKVDELERTICDIKTDFYLLKKSNDLNASLFAVCEPKAEENGKDCDFTCMASKSIHRVKDDLQRCLLERTWLLHHLDEKSYQTKEKDIENESKINCNFRHSKEESKAVSFMKKIMEASNHW